MKRGPGAQEASGIGAQQQESQRRRPPRTWGRQGDGAQPREHAPCCAETRMVGLTTLSPSARKAAPPAGLAASLHSGPRRRSLAPARLGVRTRAAPGAHGVRAEVQVPGCHRGAPLRAAPCFAPPGPRTPNRTPPGRAEAEGRRGADASKRGRAGGTSSAPCDLSPSPPVGSAGSASPAPPTQPGGAARHGRSHSVLGGCGRVGLGPGAGLGADPEAGLSLRQGPAWLPPVSLCLSSSLLLLRAEPGMGGPAPGRPGTVMWKLGSLGAGRWGGGGTGSSEDWRGERRRNPG